MGRLFDSRGEALQVVEFEKLDDPSADARVQPVLSVGEGLDPDEGQALVNAILEGEDFSDLPPEHGRATSPCPWPPGRWGTTPRRSDGRASGGASGEGGELAGRGHADS